MLTLAFAILLASFATAREHPNVENYGTDLPRGFRKPILGGGDTGKDEIYMIGDVSDNEDKILRRFSQWNQDGGSWSYEDWNSWRHKDGMLCRMNSDCQWWEPDLWCYEANLSWRSPEPDWFLGSEQGLVGHCRCGPELFWLRGELACAIGCGPVCIGAIIFGLILASLTICACVVLCRSKKRSQAFDAEMRTMS